MSEIFLHADSPTGQRYIQGSSLLGSVTGAWGTYFPTIPPLSLGLFLMRYGVTVTELKETVTHRFRLPMERLARRLDEHFVLECVTFFSGHNVIQN